ncbi:AraC-type DNA-binding protein [Cnuella takakiae]|uniref:AraC-type DNA-binding protein n=1 Tax=Cnuella takakiae TaxID=1302690 RepID=A0A1M5I255_9BACT|nr:AraC family transcriptional regulator [Cnuella takakiae]SHG22237.1 AraC-type DNA-binding protein [Cnuella takakiae]
MTEGPEMSSLLVNESGRLIPGSVQYGIRRYVKPQGWMAEDTGMLQYVIAPEEKGGNRLELHFCITGNMYCKEQVGGCRECKAHNTANCPKQFESVDLLTFTFTPSVLAQFVKSRAASNTLADDVLTFRHTQSFSQLVPLCNRMRSVLDGITSHNYTDTLENIFVNAQTQMLLLYSLDCMLGEKEIDVITCKFLANGADRDKILKARDVLIEHIGEPITIKELSRKVAMNECYLKKGFKEMFGTTIFDFYQNQRMEHAKYLLYEKGLSVTEVSMMLGYSSISHFSTAFKKHTGLKPCELLLR